MHLDGFSTADKLDAAVRLGGFFKDSKGPGKEFSSSPSGTPPVGLMSPHIDFHRGGPAYAWAYQALSETPAPDLIVTFGVAHMSPNSPWVMTRKAYQTPYGDMAVHTDLYGEFEKALWYSPTADEWTHRLEHSLEFQAFWLRYLWRDKTPAWLPVLTSSFERFCQDRPPSTIPTIEGAIQKMGDILKKRQDNGEKILILAGVDLAHVGQRFGDEIELTPDVRQKIETEDRVSLKHAMALEADEFYMSAIVDKHWRKNCGLSALYTSLRLIEILQGSSKKSGELLTYGQADDPLGGVVSFASALWKK
jgi:AmmeMemoRadiSam system protein B